jgi:hypothetical protein
MSIQARMTPGDNRLYNPSRDLAHNFGAIVLEAAKSASSGRWPAITKLAKEKEIPDEILGKAFEIVTKFIGRQADDPKESMHSCLARCGWLELPEYARVCVVAYIGLITIGMQHAGVREASIQGNGPAMGYKRLRWHGRKFALLMKMGWIRRSLYKLRARLRKAFRALMERDEYED